MLGRALVQNLPHLKVICWGTYVKETAAKALAKFKVPDPQNIFIHTEQLPKGPTGKLDKKGLRTHYSDIVAKRPIQSKL